MARKRTITVGAINLKVHPHPSGVYKKLLIKAYDLKRHLSVHGDRKMLVRSIDARDPEVITGMLAGYTEIDMDMPWFNTSTLGEAEENEVAEVKIPNSLKPNFKSFFYAFYPAKHMLVFETNGINGGISPNTVGKFFMRLLNDNSIKETFGEVSVDIVADIDRLEKIIGIKQLKNLSILINKPNPDDLDSVEADLKRRLAKVSATNYHEEYSSDAPDGLKPDNEIKTLAKIGLRNGIVQARGRNEDGVLVSHSSEKHPVTIKFGYDPNLLTGKSAFLKAGQVIVQKISDYLG